MTYTNLLPNVHSIIRKHMKVLYRSDRLKGIFRDLPIVAFKRDMNLSDTLIHGKTNKAVKVAQISCKPCCEMCKLLHREEVRNTKDQTAYKPVTDVTCRIRNIIYGIICKVCQSVVYVGETERELQARMTEYLKDIKLKREKPINHHFGMKGHSEKDAKIAVLEKLYGGEKIKRQLKEAIWIQKLATVRPDGCNVKNSFRTLSTVLE